MPAAVPGLEYFLVGEHLRIDIDSLFAARLVPWINDISKTFGSTPGTNMSSLASSRFALQSLLCTCYEHKPALLNIAARIRKQKPNTVLKLRYSKLMRGKYLRTLNDR